MTKKNKKHFETGLFIGPIVFWTVMSSFIFPSFLKDIEPNNNIHTKTLPECFYYTNFKDLDFLSGFFHASPEM